MKKNLDQEKKQLLLRLSKSLWQEVPAWADDEYRSPPARLSICSPKLSGTTKIVKA